MFMLVPLSIIIVSDGVQNDMRRDIVSIWVIANLTLYLLEAMLNLYFYKTVTVYTRRNFFLIGVVVDLIRYGFTIVGLVFFYGQPGLILRDEDRKVFDPDGSKKIDLEY